MAGTRNAPPPLSVELVRELLRGKTVQVGKLEDLPRLARSHYEIVPEADELVEPDAPIGSGRLKLKDLFSRLPEGTTAVVQLKTFPAGTAPYFGDLPPNTPEPFGAPDPAKKYRKAEDVMGVLGSGFVIAAVPVRSDYNRLLYTRYGDPANEIGASVEIPGEPGSKLRDLVEQTDLDQVWFVFLTGHKPPNRKRLDRLPPGAPGPLVPPTETEFGKLSAEEINRLISEEGERPKNFGTAPGGDEIQTGWEQVMEPRQRLPMRATIRVNGQPWQLGRIFDQSARGVIWLHRRGTPWTLQTIDKKHWPPYVPTKPETAKQPGAWGFISKNKRVSFWVAVMAFIALVFFASVLPGFVGLLVIIALFALVVTLNARHPSGLQQDIWTALVIWVGLALCFAAWFHWAREEPSAIAFTDGLFLAVFVAILIPIVVFLVGREDEGFFTRDNRRRYGVYILGGLIVIATLTALAIVIHNASVSNHGPTREDPAFQVPLVPASTTP